jgi:hypothetical protein
MSWKLKRVLLSLLAVALFVGVALAQRGLNADRDRLGLTRVAPLDNAPPVLAFTTVALGGFRGLISNALWIRANDLQEQDKFFEMVQLADWITKLEPHFVQVWVNQAWNMAYNISVKFKETRPGEYPDRWRWVKRGIELLRDEGLRYNPNEIFLYRELGWFFQHKMGQDLDDANMYYKQEWARELKQVFGDGTPNLDELANPQTDDARARAKIMREKFKMDPVFVKQVDVRDGPLEWRLPEAHAIYWASMGLKKAAENPTKVNKDDFITLRRVIYQSLQLSFHRGRLVKDPFVKGFELAPNLPIIGKANAAYERAIEEDEKMRDNIKRAHRNLLRDIVYVLYGYGRNEESARWYKYLAEKYPDQNLIDGDTNSLPRNLTYDQYSIARLLEHVGETDKKRVTGIIEGLLANSYRSLAIGEDEASAGYFLKARGVYDYYQKKVSQNPENIARIGLAPFDDMKVSVRDDMLDPTSGFPPEARAIIRQKLGLGPEAAPATGTNAPPENLTPPSTNAPSPPSGATGK